jgi:hypothetical protein
MAVLALGLAGGAIGGAIFGTATFLGVSAVGWGVAAGQLVGNLLFPQHSSQQGPRVGDLSVQASTYGAPIPMLFGTMRAPGNVIFCTDKREVPSEQTQGGKGGPKVTTTTYTYNVDMAVALCEGPIVGIRKIWSNSKLVFDVSETATATSTLASSVGAQGWKFYPGDEDQLPDPTIEATLGAGNVPAYRGTAYIVFDHLDCPNGQIPQLSFEIVVSGSSGPSSITFEQVPAPDSPLFALASIVENRVWQFVGDNGPQPVYSAGPGWYSNEGVRLFSTSDGGDAAPISVQGGPYAMFRSFAPGPSYETVLSIIAVNLETGTTSTPLQYIPGTSSNSLSPAFAAYDPISGDFCAITSAETDIRGMSITIFSTEALTDILMTPSTPMAFYNSVVYTCGTSAGETFLNSYDTGGALIDSIGAGEDCGFAGNLFVHASANGVYVVQGATGTTSLDRKVWKITGGEWVLLSSTSRYDNTADNAKTWWSNDEFGIVGPTGASGGVVTYTMIRYNSTTSEDVPVADVLSAICERAGATPDQVDVSDITQSVHGYAITQVSSARSSLDPLLRAFFIDVPETDGTLKFMRRAGKSALAVIPFDDLGCTSPGDGAIDPFPLTRTQEAELPRSVAITYINTDNDYQPGTETARRQVTTSAYDLTDQLAIATTPGHIATVAGTLLYDAWAQRTTRATKLPRTYAWVDVGDNVTVEYPRGAYTIKRFTKTTDDGAMLSVETVDSDPDVYSLTFPGATSVVGQDGVEYFSPTRMELLDIPILRDADNDCGLYGAFSGYSSNWNGTVVERANAAGVYSKIGGVTVPAVLGSTLTALGDWTSGLVDQTNTVDVDLSTGELASITRAAMLDTDANACVIGDEVLQFQTATSLGGTQYRLSGLRRHLRGTEWATGAHTSGERFALLQTAGMLRFPMEVGEIGAQRQYRATSVGAADATTRTFANTAVGRKPFAPSNLRRTESTTGALGYAWNRRTRLSQNWLLGNVPLGEDSELYDVELLDVDGNILLADQATTSYYFPPASAVALGQTYEGVEWGFQTYNGNLYAIADPPRVVQLSAAGAITRSSDVLGGETTQTVTDGSSLYITAASFNNFGVVSGGFVYRINLDDLSIAFVYTAATPGDPAGIAYDGANIWITERFSGNVRKLDAATLSSVASYAVAVGVEAMSYDGSGSLWIARTSSDLLTSEIIQVNTSTGAITSRFPCVKWPADVLYYGGKVFVLGISNLAVYSTAGVQIALHSVFGGAAGRQMVPYGPSSVAVLSDAALNASRQSILVLNTSDGLQSSVITSPYSNIHYLSGTTSGDLYVAGTPVGASGGASNLLALGSLDAAAFRVYQRSGQVGRGYPAELALG